MSIGTCEISAHLMLVIAYNFVVPTQLIHFEYMKIVWAFMIDILIFKYRFTFSELLAGTIIVSSVVYVQYLKVQRQKQS